MKIEISDDERAVISEVLHKIKASLPIEIHHCKVNDYKIYLKERLATVDGLIKKFE